MLDRIKSFWTWPQCTSRLRQWRQEATVPPSWHWQRHRTMWRVVDDIFCGLDWWTTGPRTVTFQVHASGSACWPVLHFDEQYHCPAKAGNSRKFSRISAPTVCTFTTTHWVTYSVFCGCIPALVTWLYTLWSHPGNFNCLRVSLYCMPDACPSC